MPVGNGNRRSTLWGAALTCRDPVGISRPLQGGAVAQLVERLVRNEEVRGSIPLSSTIPALHVRLDVTETIRYRSVSPDAARISGGGLWDLTKRR